MNKLLCLLLALIPSYLYSQSAFTVVPLGVKGGLDESNLSSYMVAPAGSNDYVCLDAGTVYMGIQRAVDAGIFHLPVSMVLRQHIKGYLISHPHLDHLAGLIINSPDDTAKTIYGMPNTLKVLEEKYFTWAGWANFGDKGEAPVLKKYHYAALEAGKEIPLTGTTMTVTAFPLSHGEPYQSTAFLIRNGEAYLLYLGDTGADTIEHAGRLAALWQTAGPLIKTGKLKAIFIETSFPNSQPEKTLFGHLTPRLLMGELNKLASVAGTKALYNFPIVITHRKPSGNQEAVIKKELEANNPPHVKLIFPRQGSRLEF
ncbi:MAG: 3',5'-cyclic-nucleotide phosphodiesterase [Sphingobacteriales bacterium 50-39]|nr:3',5'-cyclic-nucleotide phosphodiesterase [Sphingobacteriales bacterium]OJW56359.1 MAG: 3',5'-cyclic-nucleotide phosphodiesterase [Sphingobacteriales bacterium 50-39]